MRKKFLSTVLAALMIAGSATMTFAKTYDDVKEDNKAATEISILSDIGVIKGTSENEYSPDNPVTREQMATLLFRLMLGRDDAGRENTTGFTDLYEPYYNGAISWANAAGYILGTSKTTFNPTGGITKQDAMTMLVRALGQESDQMNAGYPWSYINMAVRLGLDRGLEDVAYTATLTRAETAKILYNAMTSELLVTKTAQNGSKYAESTSIIEEVFGYSMTDAVLTATNHYAIEGETVVKNGYVALTSEDGKVMTVDAKGMHLDGEADEHLGEAFRVITKEENGRREALSAVPMTEKEEFDTAKIDKNRVKIGDQNYTLVKDYSDALATNENELKLYAYDEDGVLEQIGSVDELKPLLGFYKITMMRGEGEETAKRAILTPYKLGQLDVAADGKVNLADNRDDADVKNPDSAISGDYVLYYYNKSANELRIAEILEISAGSVRRLTATTAKIGDETYDLGNETAGIGAQAIHDKLALGSNATVVLHHNAIVGVIEGTVYTASSRYLAAVSDAYRIFENGEFRYIMTDGEQKNIYVNDGAAKKGEVYRYTEQDGVYTLIAPETEDGRIVTGRREFVQKNGGLDEIALIIREAKNSEIALAGKNTYVLKAGDAEAQSSAADLKEIEFICTDDSVIAVNVNGKWVGKRGIGLD